MSGTRSSNCSLKDLVAAMHLGVGEFAADGGQHHVALRHHGEAEHHGGVDCGEQVVDLQAKVLGERGKIFARHRGSLRISSRPLMPPERACGSMRESLDSRWAVTTSPTAACGLVMTV